MILDPSQARARLTSVDNLANKIAELRRSRKASAAEVFPPFSRSDENPSAVNWSVVDGSESSESIEHVRKGAGKELPRLPGVMRERLREVSQEGIKTQKEIAEELGITQPSVSYHKRRIEAEEKAALEAEQARDPEVQYATARELALEKLMVSMGLLNSANMAGIKPRDLAGIAKDMASVIEKTTPKTSSNGASLKLMIYSPSIRKEADYQVVEIRQDDMHV